MNHLQQDRSYNCGQTCVAILLNRTITFIEKQVGKKGKTTTHNLKAVLKRKYDFPERMKSFRGRKIEPDTFPKVALVRISHSVSKGHWIVIENGKSITVFDPSHKVSHTWKEYKEVMIKYNLKMTSYLPLWKDNGSWK